jgi:hypothetical protein
MGLNHLLCRLAFKNLAWYIYMLDSLKCSWDSISLFLPWDILVKWSGPLSRRLRISHHVTFWENTPFAKLSSILPSTVYSSSILQILLLIFFLKTFHLLKIILPPLDQLQNLLLAHQATKDNPPSPTPTPASSPNTTVSHEDPSSSLVPSKSTSHYLTDYHCYYDLVRL